jgi:hypothetical protein
VLGFARVPRLIALIPLLVALACGGKDDGADDAATTEESGTSETGDGDGDVDEDVFARGIRADDIYINQGVEVPVVMGGEWIGPLDRVSPIVRERTTMIRVPWVYEDGWEPREIEARLIIDSNAHEESLVVKQTKLIDKEAYPGDLDRNFAWVVPGEEIVAGMELRVELYEVDESYADLPEPEPPPVSPAGGSELLGIEEFPAELKVVLVPVDYTNTNGNCKTLPIPDEAQLEKFRQYLFERNGVQNVQLRIHDTPIVREGTLSNLDAFFMPLQQYRIMDGAEPNEYYFALVDACAGGVGGAGGIAAGLPPPTKMAAPGRVCVGLWLDNSPNFSYETFVHEIGHTQGRPHTYCPGGGADGPDPNFPDPDGKIGTWGFGIETFVLRSPTSQFDYMSYCNPTWVSGWNWVKTLEQIRILTSWDYEDGVPEPDPLSAENEILVGVLHQDGTEQWWTTFGGINEGAVDPDSSIRYETSEGTIDVAATREVLDDGTIYVTAPMPMGMDAVAGIERRSGEDAVTIDTHEVSVQPRSWAEWHARH